MPKGIRLLAVLALVAQSTGCALDLSGNLPGTVFRLTDDAPPRLVAEPLADDDPGSGSRLVDRGPAPVVPSAVALATPVVAEPTRKAQAEARRQREQRLVQLQSEMVARVAQQQAELEAAAEQFPTSAVVDAADRLECCAGLANPPIDPGNHNRQTATATAQRIAGHYPWVYITMMMLVLGGASRPLAHFQRRALRLCPSISRRKSTSFAPRRPRSTASTASATEEASARESTCDSMNNVVHRDWQLPPSSPTSGAEAVSACSETLCVAWCNSLDWTPSGTAPAPACADSSRDAAPIARVLTGRESASSDDATPAAPNAAINQIAATDQVTDTSQVAATEETPLIQRASAIEVVRVTAPAAASRGSLICHPRQPIIINRPRHIGASATGRRIMHQPRRAAIRPCNTAIKLPQQCRFAGQPRLIAPPRHPCQIIPSVERSSTRLPIQLYSSTLSSAAAGALVASPTAIGPGAWSVGSSRTIGGLVILFTDRYGQATTPSLMIVDTYQLDDQFQLTAQVIPVAGTCDHGDLIQGASHASTR